MSYYMEDIYLVLSTCLNKCSGAVFACLFFFFFPNEKSYFRDDSKDSKDKKILCINLDFALNDTLTNKLTKWIN